MNPLDGHGRYVGVALIELPFPHVHTALEAHERLTGVSAVNSVHNVLVQHAAHDGDREIRVRSAIVTPLAIGTEISLALEPVRNNSVTTNVPAGSYERLELKTTKT